MWTSSSPSFSLSGPLVQHKAACDMPCSGRGVIGREGAVAQLVPRSWPNNQIGAGETHDCVSLGLACLIADKNCHSSAPLPSHLLC